MNPDTRLRRTQRLRSSAAFQETFSQNKSWRGRLMVLLLRAGEGAALRLGVISSRASVGNAVQRNRARRRLRAAYRLNRSQFSGPYDVVLIARRPLLTAPWNEVAGELRYLARKSGLMKAESGGASSPPKTPRAMPGGSQGASP